MKKLDDAKADYEELLKLDPSNKLFQNELNNLQKSIEAYDKGLKIDSLNAELQENRHRLLLNPDTTRIILLPSAKSVSEITSEMIGTVHIIHHLGKFNIALN